MHRRFLALAVAGMLGGCFHLAPANTGGELPTDEKPLFASLSIDDQQRLMRERIEAYLRRQCLPDLRVEEVAFAKVESWADHPALQTVGRFPGMPPRGAAGGPQAGIREPQPGPWWIATVRGNWRQASAGPGEMSAVSEGKEATFAFSAVSGQTHLAWLVPDAQPPKMVPTATLRQPPFHNPTFDRDEPRRPRP